MNNYFVVTDKQAYFYPVEENCMQPFPRKTVNFAIQKMLDKVHMPFPSFLINKELLGAHKIVLTEYAFHPSLYRTLSKMIGEKNVYLYYLNNIDSNTIGAMKYFNKSNVFTFSAVEADKYNIGYKHTPYSSHISIKSSTNPKYDFLYVGRVKDRSEVISDLYDYLLEKGYNVKFLVLGSNDPRMRLDTYMSYQKYLQLVADSRCIVEINNENQTGCTLRFMESLFLGKKLLTNNMSLKYDSLYCKDNVMFTNETDERNIIKFLGSGSTINEAGLTELDFQNWIDEF